MSGNLAFRECFCGPHNINTGALTFRIVFKMCYRSFSVYLAIDELKIGRALKRRTKSTVSITEASESLSELLKS